MAGSRGANVAPAGGFELPDEDFVKQALTEHFEAEGYRVDQAEGRRPGQSQWCDLICVHQEARHEWRIEAKGSTSEPNTDFQTALGQLLQRMTDSAPCYGVAVPRTASYLRLCRGISPWVRQALGLHWLIVSEDGTVEICPPGTEPGAWS